MNQGQNSTGYASSKEVPAPGNPIPVALSSLHSAIHDIGVAADTLANRLGGVMMPSGPEAAKATGERLASVLAVSSTTDEINSLRRRVENISAQLQDVLTRLEV